MSNRNQTIQLQKTKIVALLVFLQIMAPFTVFAATDISSDTAASNNNDAASVACTDNELIQNSSFESPVITNSAKWDIFDVGTPGLAWQAEWLRHYNNTPAVTKIELQNGWAAQSGTQFTEMDSDYFGPNGVDFEYDASIKLYQDLPTIIGQKYMISFWTSPKPGHGPDQNKTSVSIGGQLLDTITENGLANTNTVWTNHSYEFTATTITSRLQFTDLGNGNSFGMFIDTVSVKAKCDAIPTPTPSITPTPFPSGNPTPTPTPFPSGNPTPTPTPFPSGNPTPTPFPSGNPTPTPTPFPSDVPTPTPFPSGNPTPTPSVTPFPSGNPTPTPSVTPFPSGNPTPTPTPDGNPTPSATPTPDNNPTPTPTPDNTPTPTPTPGDVGGSGESGGHSSSGSSSNNHPTPTPIPTPTGRVLGDVTNNDDPSGSGGSNGNNNSSGGKVDSAATELPRTGTPLSVMLYLILSLFGIASITTFIVHKKRQS